MCGICGWLNIQNQIDHQVFSTMNNRARHRGPDDEGYLSISNDGMSTLFGKDSCDFVEYDGNIEVFDCKNSFLLLGHRRLSIIDLSSAGHQPMCIDDMAITYNGEIFNYVEIREELKTLGVAFNTKTDTEVILKAYQKWGEECVSHFNGMWAFAIWDSKANKLFCSRDRLGVKPFYYSIKDGEFIFASEIKQLCANDNIKRVLNESVMVTQIMWGLADYSEDTLIQDIKALCGGYNIVIQLNSKRTEIESISKYKYWDIDTHKKDDEAEDKLDSVLRNAITIRTRSDAPIGIMLSGGLDSSCVVAEIADIYKKNGRDSKELNTYTSCYENFSEGDERTFAKMVNDYCGTTQNFIYPDCMNTLEKYKEMIWYLEGACSLSALGSFLMLEEIGKTDTKVLVYGQGADEALLGYERYHVWRLKDLIKRGRFSEFVRTFKEASNNSGLSIKKLVQYYVYFSLLMVRKGNCYRRMRQFVTADVKRRFFSDKSVNELVKQDNLQDLQYVEIRRGQLSNNLRIDDRMFMSQSIESRGPFVDYEFVECTSKIPEHKKIQRGYTKYLLRKIYSEKLPDEVIWRKNKMGWPSPKKRWAERFDETKVEDVFSNSRVGKYFDIDKLRKLFKKDKSAYPIEQFLTIEFFVCQFDVEIP